MPYKILLLIFFIITISCDNKPAWQKEGWTEDQFQPEILEISKAKFEGHPILMSTDSLIKIKGNPLKIIDSCSIIPIVFRQAKIIYSCWIYGSKDEIAYQTLNGSAYLNWLNFENSDLVLKTPKIDLSKETRLTDFKKDFPNSYAHRNIGAASYPRDEYEWIYLNDDLSMDKQIFPNKVELVFKKGRLYQFRYQQEPKYTDTQLEEYVKWRKSRKQITE